MISVEFELSKLFEHDFGYMFELRTWFQVELEWLLELSMIFGSFRYWAIGFMHGLTGNEQWSIKLSILLRIRLRIACRAIRFVHGDILPVGWWHELLLFVLCEIKHKIVNDLRGIAAVFYSIPSSKYIYTNSQIKERGKEKFSFHSLFSPPLPPSKHAFNFDDSF